MRKIINTRSPFFVQFASAEQTVYLKLKVWVGDIATIPTEVTYTLTKEVTDGAATFEIAELMRDFLGHTSSLTSGYAWAEITTGDGVATDNTEIFFVTEGYTLYDEGLQSPNSLIDTPIPMTSVKTIYIAKGKTLAFPIYANNENDLFFYKISDSNGTSGGSIPFSNTTLSSTQVKYVVLNSTDTEFSTDLDGKETKYIIKEMDCKKYTPVMLTFVNRYGAKEQYWFTLKHKERLNTSNDTFQRSLVDYNGMTSGNQLHAFRKRITGSKQAYTINADFINEAEVELFEEMFLSEYIWLSIDGGTAIPVNLKDSSFDKKNHVNDRLIQYTFKVETASNYINTVR